MIDQNRTIFKILVKSDMKKSTGEYNLLNTLFFYVLIFIIENNLCSFE